MRIWQPLYHIAAISVLLDTAALSEMGLSQTRIQDAQRAVVVKLNCHFAGRGDETAAGLFVGKDQQNAFFITVRHAIAAVDDSGLQVIPATSVTLQFANSAMRFKATIFDHSDPTLDLAVVYLPLSNLPPDLPQVTQAEATASLPVTIIGHPAAGDWSVWEGSVVNETAPEGDVHHYITTSNPSLAKGYSGGPEFDSSGNFLGMQTAYETTYGIAARGSEIIAQLRAWRIPTNDFIAKADGHPTADTEAIQGVLRSYEEAYNRLDSSFLWTIWPNVPSKTRQAIEHYFASATSIRAKLQAGAFDISSGHTDATVSGRFSQQFTPRLGNPPPTREDEIRFTLKKNAGTWVIVDVR